MGKWEIGKEAMENARYFEGDPPEGCELAGMRENAWCRMRYYRDREGHYWFSSQRLRDRREPEARYELVKDSQGRETARLVGRRLPGKAKAVRA